MKAVAPGKLILSGEHAVVFGKPALAMAVDRNAESIITAGLNDEVNFNMLDYGENESFRYIALRELKNRVLKNYHMFLNGDLGIRDVLHKPIDLIEFAFVTVIDGLQHKLDDGLNIQLQSNIPIGCGMGSSAATVLSVLRGVSDFMGLDLDSERYYKFGVEAEKVQHGHPSGVDSYVSLHGGCVKFEGEQRESLPLPRIPLYMVHTGTPDSTTGECVVHVHDRFKNSKIWEDFEGVTRAMEAALKSNDPYAIADFMKENQRLLEAIGVVPTVVQNFVADIEKWGASAKICGAGSVKGDKGGVVLVASDVAPNQICEKYGYAVRPVRGDPLGARIVG